MFEIIKNGIFSKVGPPVYGTQDIGVTPGGVMDSFSYETGNILLNNPADAPALEIILPPSLKFREDCYFILTGAKYRDVSVTCNGEKKVVDHGRICFAPAGSILEFNRREYGFRTYLCYSPAKNAGGTIVEGKARGPFAAIASWPDADGRIRIIEGPEFGFLDDKDVFVNDYWKVTNDISPMGMRIENKWADVAVTMDKNMVSEAVSNGTVQLTPDGPIVLLKHRQTVGGYPRIFNVISVDVDLLAQFSPGQLIHFKKVTIDEARDALKKRSHDLLKLRQDG